VNRKPHGPNAEGGDDRGKKQRTPIESALRELYVVIHFVARTAAGTWTTVLRFTRHEMKMFGQGEELTLIVPRTSWWRSRRPSLFGSCFRPGQLELDFIFPNRIGHRNPVYFFGDGFRRENCEPGSVSEQSQNVRHCPHMRSWIGE
jgi:hypothetical protein